MTSKTIAELRREVERIKRKIERREAAREAEIQDPERPRGVLSEADREYLIGDGDYTRQARYERRTSVEQRLTHSVKDLRLLAELWPVAGVDPSVTDEDIESAISFLKAIKAETPTE